MKLLSLFGALAFGLLGFSQTTELVNCPGPTTVTTFNEQFSCNTVAGATEYEFTFTDVSLVNPPVVYIANWHTIHLFQAGLTDLGKTYDVSVRAKVGGVFGAPGSTCTLIGPTAPPSTDITSANCGSFPLSIFNQLIYCESVAGATEYEFEFTPPSGPPTTVTNTFQNTSLFAAGLFDFNVTYSVRARAKIGGTFGPYGATCALTSPNTAPSTALQPSHCGITLTSYSFILKALPVVGATSYKFEFYDAGTTNLVGTSIETYQNTSLVSAGLGGIPNAQYDVRVSVILGSGSTYTTPGAICQVLAPSIVPYTKIQNPDCGLQTTAFADPFDCNPLTAATQYEFEFVNLTNPGPAIYATSATTEMSLATAGITDNNTTYEVKVRATINGVTGIFGLPCIIHSPTTLPLPNLVPSSCNITLNSFAQNFTTSSVPGATEYRFRLFNTTPGAPSPTTIFDKAFSTTNLLEIGLLDPNVTYDVDIAAKVGGVYLSYGSVCQLTSPAITSPAFSTSLDAASCGASLASINTQFTANTVVGATDYTFEFTNTTTSAVTEFTKSWKTTTLLEAGLTDINAAYNVRVKATVNGVIGQYSATCALTGPTAVPTTDILSVCGTTLSSFGQVFLCQNVPGASEYEFEFTNMSTNVVTTHTRPWRSCSFALAGISDAGTLFSVRVRAKIGTTFGNFGSVCTITTPAPAPVSPDNIAAPTDPNTDTQVAGTKSGSLNTTDNNTAVIENVEFSVYPNPASEFVNIMTDIADYSISVYNVNGQLVYSETNLNNQTTISVNELVDGFYILSVNDNNGTVVETKKLVVKH